MTDRLDEIRERHAAITPGPWKARALPYDWRDDPWVESAGGLYVCQTVYDTLSPTEEHNVDEDTDFIAHAPSDIAYLLKEVDNLTHDIGEALNTITLEVEARVKAEAEVERLRRECDTRGTEIVQAWRAAAERGDQP